MSHPMYNNVKFPEQDIDAEPAQYPKMKYKSQPQFPEPAVAGVHYEIVNNAEEEAAWDKANGKWDAKATPVADKK